MVIHAIFIFFVPLLDLSWDLPFIILGEYFQKSDGIKTVMTLPFMKKLIVCVHLKAVQLLILLTSFAKVTDPYLFCYAFLKIPGMCLLRSYVPCCRDRIRMAAVRSKWHWVKTLSKPVIHHSDKK